MMVQGHYPNMVELFRLVNFSKLYIYMQGGGAPEIVKLKIIQQLLTERTLPVLKPFLQTESESSPGPVSTRHPVWNPPA